MLCGGWDCESVMTVVLTSVKQSRLINFCLLCLYLLILYTLCADPLTKSVGVIQKGAYKNRLLKRHMCPHF